MNACMYILVPHDLQMSKGKMAAQVAHAAVEAYRISATHMLAAWYVGGHYKKIVLECDDLQVAAHYLAARGFQSHMIIDEGRTEFNGGLTPTALGCAVVDKDHEHVAATFSIFDLYGTKARKDREAERRKRQAERTWTGKEEHVVASGPGWRRYLLRK